MPAVVLFSSSTKIEPAWIDVWLVDLIVSMVAMCTSSSSRERFRGYLSFSSYVKRGFPYSAEHPREHLESVRDLMIVLDSNEHDEELLQDLRTYFSSYGLLYACKYCHESSFDYVLVEFADHGNELDHRADQRTLFLV